MRLAIFLPNWIGDTCMATPALRAISKLPRIERMTLFGKPGPLAVLEETHFCREVVAYKPGSRGENVLSRRGVARYLRQQKYDTALLFPNSLSTALIAFFGKVPHRVGFARGGRSLLLSQAVSTAVSDTSNGPSYYSWKVAPTIDYYLHLASQLGADSTNKQMELQASKNDLDKAKRLLEQVGFSLSRPLVLINNSAAAAISRLWADTSVQMLAQMLAKEDIQVLMHASPADRQRMNQLAIDCGESNVQSMGIWDDLPLGLSRGLLSLANVVVSTDSGVRHMAVAFNRPVVSLFGSTSPMATRTYNVPESIFQLSLPCQPCGKKVCPLQHQRCMRELSPKAVFQAVLSRLENANRESRPAA